MNTINIITELCQEDRKRIDELIAGISLLTGVIGSTLPQAKVINKLADPPPAAEPVEEAPAPVEEPKAEEAPAPAPIVIPFPEFQKAVTLAVSKGPEAKTAVKTIINKYAASVSAVPEDKRADIIAELANI